MKNDIGIFIFGLTSAFFALTIQNILEPTWVSQAYKAKAECEENIPRKEVCVAVFLAHSKD